MYKQNQEAKHNEVLLTFPHMLSVTEWLQGKNMKCWPDYFFYIECDLMFELKQGVLKHISFHKTFKMEMETHVWQL